MIALDASHGQAPAPAGDAGATRRMVFAGGALAVAGAAGFALTPRRRAALLGAAKLSDVLPRQVGPWAVAQGAGAILPDSEPADFYDQVATRDFAAAGLPPIMLLVAYGAAQRGLIRVHRPEICYESAGFVLENPRDYPVALDAGHAVPARTFVADRQDRREQVLFWIRVGQSLSLQTREQKLAMLERGLQGVIPDGVLVRVSTLWPDTAQGLKALTAFAQALVGAAPPRVRELLVGAPSATKVSQRA
jgi:EpsI family protein